MMVKIYLKLKLLFLALLISTSSTSIAQTIVLGSGTGAHGNTAAGPISEYYENTHCQMVYTAAEIIAGGINGGTMTNFGFYVQSTTGPVLPNYTIKMKHTTATDAATYDGTGLSTVYNGNYTPVAGGFDMFTLSAPFVWNGTDNILVDVCFDLFGGFASNGTVRIYSPTVTNGLKYSRSDVTNQCGLTCSTNSSNKPQAQMTFLPPPPFDLGITAFAKPLASKPCFGNDTIIATLKNYGSQPADFSVNPTTITVKTAGPTVNTYTMIVNSGTIASGATQDYTISTNYNMSNAGVYNLKGYTTATGDGLALNDTTNLSVTKAPFFTTFISPNDSVCLGTPVQLKSLTTAVLQVGNGSITNSSTGYPAPYGNYYEGARHQFLILESELTAAGVTAGDISSLSFYATSLNGTDPLLNYNISLATTTITSISAFETGFTTYFSSPSYTPVVGANTHNFTTPFIWDGVSNIIVQTCFDNTSAGFSNNVSILQTTTLFTSSVWHRQDGNSGICADNTTTSTMTQRPNFGFGQPINSVVYSWSPATELSATNIPNPVANITTTRTYTVTANLGGCITNDNIKLNVKPTPLPSLGNDTIFCTLPQVLNVNTTADSYLWSNGSTASTLSINNAGTYWVRATNLNGCVNTDTIKTVAGTLPIVTLGPDTAFCQGSSINLYAGNPGSTYQWNTGSTASFITVSTIGTYSVIVTNSTSCKSTDIVNVTSKLSPTVSLVFTGQTTFCPIESGRSLTEGTPSGGTYIGAGVSGNTFNANQAGQGTYIIFYSYTGPNSCTSIAKDTLIVNACVGIEELSGNIGLNVYPNPNTGLFTLEINTNNDIDGKIKVLTIDGRMVYDEMVSGNGLITRSIDIASLANGIYYLRLETKDAVKTYKVLKQ